MSDYCDIYRDPDSTNFITSLFIAAGIVASYIPQYYTIINTRVSIGLSATYLFLFSLASASSVTNLILLSFISLPCCSVLSPFECVNSQVSLIQVGLQSICTLAIPLLCVIYTDTPENTEYKSITKAWRVVVWYLTGTLVLLFIAKLYFSHEHIILLANALGIMSTIITFIQYIPQIMETYRFKASGALSVMMMCIQTPGGFVWTTTLMLKPGSQWSSWLPYLSAATLQGVVLLMCIYYDFCYDHDINRPLLPQVTNDDGVPNYGNSS